MKRLILDGLDDPLARLFVHAATPEDREDRARSASEAFLFKRMETLDETQGRFEMNNELPIPFNQRGTMEVDFLCESLKLVIELDGISTYGRGSLAKRSPERPPPAAPRLSRHALSHN